MIVKLRRYKTFPGQNQALKVKIVGEYNELEYIQKVITKAVSELLPDTDRYGTESVINFPINKKEVTK